MPRSSTRSWPGNDALLDSKLLERHFSPGLLFSDEARSAVVEPDIRPLPALAA